MTGTRHAYDIPTPCELGHSRRADNVSDSNAQRAVGSPQQAIRNPHASFGQHGASQPELAAVIRHHGWLFRNACKTCSGRDALRGDRTALSLRPCPRCGNRESIPRGGAGNGAHDRRCEARVPVTPCRTRRRRRRSVPANWDLIEAVCRTRMATAAWQPLPFLDPEHWRCERGRRSSSLHRYCHERDCRVWCLAIELARGQSQRLA